MRQFFLGLPHELEEAGRMDGLSRFGIFWRIAFPLARPAVAAVAIFNFLGLWNQYLLPVALNTKRNNWVLSQAVASFVSGAGYQSEYGLLFAGVVITIVPVLVGYVLFQRQLQGSVSQGTMK